MFSSRSLLTFSLPFGRLWGASLRLSFLMPVFAVALMWRLQDIVFGIVAFGIVLLTLIVHELAHIAVCRHFGHNPGLLVIWPLGGMSSVQPSEDFRKSVLIAGAGPAVSLLIATAVAIYLQSVGQFSGLLNPFNGIDFTSAREFGIRCLRVAFLANWCLGLFNLIPVRPLDAGQVCSSILNLRFMEMETQDLMLRIGLGVSLFGLFAGFVFDISSLVALAAFLLVLHIHEAAQWLEPPRSTEESFTGYDFSEGYTSLEREEGLTSEEVHEHEDVVQQSIMERWRIRREEERLRRESEERLFEEQQLDVILEKLFTEGRDALSGRELNVLNRVSARLRERHFKG